MSLSSSHHADSQSPEETGQKHQRTTFDSFESLLHSPPDNNHNDLSLVTGQPENSMSDENHLIEFNYPNNPALPPEDQERGSKRRMFPIYDQMPTISITQSAIIPDDSYNHLHNVGMNSQLNHIQHQPQEQEPLPILGLNTQNTRTRRDENLTTSKHLSDTMPDMYY